MLKLASERVEHFGLGDKAPSFLHLPGGSLEPIRNKKFDVIWAQSVLTHLPETLIEQFFDLAKETLNPKVEYLQLLQLLKTRACNLALKTRLQCTAFAGFGFGIWSESTGYKKLVTSFER